MGQLLFVINLLLTAAGIYMTFVSVKMKRTHKIAGQIYLSGDLQAKKCKQEKEYCDYVAPRGIVTGLLVTVIAFLAAAGYFLPALEVVTDWSFAAVIALYIWFVYYSGSANKKYFGK